LDFVGNQEGTGGFAQGIMELPFYARWYEFFRPTLTRLITPRTLQEEYVLSTRLLHLESGSQLLDVGCGTGNFTRHFARYIRSRESTERSFVTGLDLSWPMLTEARERSFREDLENRIQYLRGDALNLPFRNDRFDRLHCAGSLHLMDSIQTVLGEFRRVLRPESKLVIGTFLLGDGTLRPLVKRLGGWLTRFHWFGENELKERLRGQGFVVDEFSVSGDAVTFGATLQS
jgi:ubiquinone/menaquinone biosynthesis C-methylase UbiE